MGISIWQIVLVLVIIVILFGAGKIPRVMGDIAKGIKSFKAGMREEEQEEINNQGETIEGEKVKSSKRKTNNSKKK
tara:strand:+ start:420 stop:647 length:228 start_codon:yes stop_codon:yes gene_type:complete